MFRAASLPHAGPGMEREVGSCPPRAPERNGQAPSRACGLRLASVGYGFRD